MKKLKKPKLAKAKAVKLYYPEYGGCSTCCNH